MGLTGGLPSSYDYGSLVNKPVSLECECHECFSVFSSSLTTNRILEQHGYVSSPGQLDSDNTVLPEVGSG